MAPSVEPIKIIILKKHDPDSQRHYDVVFSTLP